MYSFGHAPNYLTLVLIAFEDNHFSSYLFARRNDKSLAWPARSIYTTLTAKRTVSLPVNPTDDSVTSTSPVMSVHSVTAEQPEKLLPPSPSHLPESSSQDLRSRVKHIKRKVTTRHGWLGDYDYAWLCMPNLPWKRGGKRVKTGPPFYALDSDLPIVLAAASGLQHALAMLAGLITPPIIFANALNLDSETSAYMISASLIGCGESSICVW